MPSLPVPHERRYTSVTMGPPWLYVHSIESARSKRAWSDSRRVERAGPVVGHRVRAAESLRDQRGHDYLPKGWMEGQLTCGLARPVGACVEWQSRARVKLAVSPMTRRYEYCTTPAQRHCARDDSLICSTLLLREV